MHVCDAIYAQISCVFAKICEANNDNTNYDDDDDDNNNNNK